MSIMLSKSNDVKSPLSFDILANTFRYLTPKEAANAVAVCKLWRLVFTKAPRMTDYVFQKGAFQYKVVSELPALVRYPKGLVKMLHQNGILVSQLPRGEIPNVYGSKIVQYDECRVPMTVVNSSQGLYPSTNRIVFRVIGSTLPLAAILDRGVLFPRARGVFSIFQCNQDRTWTASMKEIDSITPNPGSWSASSGHAADIIHLSSIVSNPISLIWLYCSGEITAYVDLLQYIPVPNTTMTLY